MDSRAIVVSEDRASLEPAVRLLLASLNECSPMWPVHVYFPPASEEFQAWAAKLRNVRLFAERLPGDYSKYDVKPHAFLHLMGQGIEEVVWIDTDIVLNAPLDPLFSALGDDTIVIAEEALGPFPGDPDSYRARSLGYEPGRRLVECLNTGVLRLTTRHLTLIEEWRRILTSDAYLDAQSMAWDKRPIQLMGDQDVLTGLLSARPFAHLPLRLVARGREIVQFFGPYGFTFSERIRQLLGQRPIFIHSMGAKPWWREATIGGGGYERFLALYRDLSPYTVTARRYRAALVDDAWLTPATGLGRFFSAIGLNNAALTGLPLAAAADLLRFWKRARRMGREPDSLSQLVEKQAQQ